MHPRARGIVLALVFVAIFLGKSLMLLMLVWLCMLALLRQEKMLAAHTKFVAFAVIPIALALVLVWSAAQVPPPTTPIDCFAADGPGYAMLVSFRILAAGSLLQAMLMPEFAAGRLTYVLRSWGLGARGAQVANSSITLLDDLKRKLQQVIEARTARGLMPPTRWGKFRALPVILRPVFFASLESAIKRAELWDHRGIDPLAIVDTNTNGTPWRWLDTTATVMAALFLVCSIWIAHGAS